MISIVIQGTLESDGTLKLDQAPNLPPGPVVVTVQPAVKSAPNGGGLAGVIDDIRQGQHAGGYAGRSAEDIDSVRREGEAEYEKRMQVLKSQTNLATPTGGS
jgi:hypothetical protein